jgi:hypothetical protein
VGEPDRGIVLALFRGFTQIVLAFGVRHVI